MESLKANVKEAIPSRNGRPVADFLKPRIIEPEGNEEFLDKVAAIFVEQVLAAREAERLREQSEHGN